MTSKLKLWLAIALVVVFVAGVAAGLCGGAFYMHHMFVGGHRGFVGRRMHEHLRRELQLTPEQNEKVMPILDQLDQRLQEIREDTGRRVSEAMNQSHEQV